MEKEFLELIKTFEKAGSRLGKLDVTILDFKQVVEDLRGNLDELVEMVQLEQIVELSTQSIARLKNLDVYLTSLEHYQEQMVKRLENQAHVLGQLINEETEGLASNFLYQIDEKTLEVSVIPIGKSGKKKVIQNLQVRKLLIHNKEAFALNREGTILYVLNGENPVSIMHQPIEDFAICGYQLYFLSNKQLQTYHLLTKEQTTILSNVIHMTSLKDGYHLLCETENQNSIVVKMV